VRPTGKGLRYVLRRLALALPTIIIIVVLNFALLHLAPGDAADVLAGEAGSATPEYMAQLRQKFGLDQPLLVQLAAYLKRVLILDLGYSFRHNMTVTELIAHLWDDECPTAPVEAVIDEFREESPTTERPRTRRKETLDERTLVFRVNR